MPTAPTMPARDLVLAFFHAASDRSLDVSTLVTATGALGLTGNATRVALSRLGTEGWVARDERGRYRLRPDRVAAASGLATFKSLPTAMTRWKNGWLACVFDAGRKPAALPDELRRLGFRSPAPGLAVRPDNLRGGSERLEAKLGEGRLFELTPLGRKDAAANWPALWEPDAYSKGYAQMRERIRKSRARLAKLSAEAQLPENFSVAQSCIARLEQDPLLPDAWIDAEARARLVDELVAYDRDARAHWMKMIPGLELAGSLRASTPWTSEVGT